MSIELSISQKTGTVAFDEYDEDWNSEAYQTVSGQNSNNSVRLNNEFMQAVEQDKEEPLLAC